MPTTLITGASRGIGLALAEQYAETGFRVLATCRNPEAARKLQRLAAGSPLCSVHRLDVTDDASVRGLARELSGVPIDVVINNAGMYGPRPVEGGQRFGSLDYQALAQVLDTNLFGPLRVTEAFLEHLLAGERKVLVAITSQMGSIERNSGGAYAYRSSKAALNCAMKGLSHELAGRGVTVCLLHPGWVSTDMGGRGAPVSPQESAAGIRQVIERLGPSDTGSFLDYHGEALPW